MNYPNIFAIVGATCSGKSALSLELAPLLNAYIFSLDSLCIYREVDIASAKPSNDELAKIKHFAINILSPNEHVSASLFLSLLHESIQYCKKEQKNLLIVGGSSFYLKAIMQGLSPLDTFQGDNIRQTDFMMLKEQPLSEQYKFLTNIDSVYAEKISSNDTYRITKALEIFFQTNMSPTQFFIQNPPVPFFLPINIYSLIVPKVILHKNIEIRTHNMMKSGIIKEATRLLETYGSEIQPFKSIGLKECLMFLRGEIGECELEHLIALHTRQLAKRQTTFNRTQFSSITQICHPFNIQAIAHDMLTKIKTID
ncbi:tRNA (adenosine(37)-N6)-dimethylallyltransferase MiaA [Helicobacter trogontum]|uniref:tRNA dimethylallyltransferase n=1 Tax=Helicobacter trogontum TaxID=50960 RepID=A0A4U8TE01_9HELI|nr:tRNA (adenosine(37)-N6)-dimethylallyltransferase MiaA [Helicobacter trogontum]MCI5787104.1 tRNA (adenosine(37)-N6)-dimethylallyltransferase MiaA [Helicobacter trogontum]MDY5184690.1 tRNA (adenosine(37)-N6)-dimethylallyltransferase MiaA [Helicobacter trogontum]TLD97924.1 tRNA (adenosine(37)-N6)-dimethylallyltransferase MiaA [Helicobacter trogontum]